VSVAQSDILILCATSLFRYLLVNFPYRKLRSAGTAQDHAASLGRLSYLQGSRLPFDTPHANSVEAEFDFQPSTLLGHDAS
jgi:hypothetical protein